jgi:hypothetical protein
MLIRGITNKKERQDYINYMKRTFYCILLLLLICTSVFSQEKNWRVDVFSFFDNTEFGRSAVKIPQTMAGVMVAPEAGIVWDTVNKVNLGVNLMHEFGSPRAIDRFYPTLYYESNRGPMKFIMGAFPRARVLNDYPRLFFQDSVSYYRPNINGIFTEYRKGENHFNIWLDWTGRQSKTVNEEFFIGFSGRYKTGILYIQHFGAMFHYAGKMDPVVDEPLHDNLLFLTSAGIDLAGRTVFNKLEMNVGWTVREERSRLDNSGWISSNGLLMETRLEYKWLGLFNTFYKGDNMMYYYNKLGNRLYWGDPTYRSKVSDRADIYIDFLHKRDLSLILTYSLTFMESRIYHEQMLKVVVNLNSLRN